MKPEGSAKRHQTLSSRGCGLGTRLTLGTHVIWRHSLGHLSRQLLAFLVQTCSQKGQQNPLEIHRQEHSYMVKQTIKT